MTPSRNEAIATARAWRPDHYLAGRVADVVSLVWLGAALGLVFVTFDDYGITWDEPWHVQYGNHILAWVVTGGADGSALSYRQDYLYGGAYDLLGAVVRRYSTLDAYETMHLVGGLLGTLGLAGTWALGRAAAGRIVGLLALIFVSTTPVYVGHMFNNPKDLPFAVGYVWALYFLTRWAQTVPRVPRRVWVGSALSLGFAASVRVGGMLTFAFFVALVLAFIMQRSLRSPDPAMVALACIRRLGARAAAVLIGAWAVMVVCWPWALMDPLRRPVVSLMKMTRFELHERVMPFAGEPMLTTEPRWDYLVHYFGLKIPVLVLALAIGGAVLTGVTAWRRRTLPGVVRWRYTVPLLAAALVMPPLYSMVARSVLYDGLRHFLFVVPVLCVAAALGAALLVHVLRPRLRFVGPALAAVVALSSGNTISAMVALHPHEYVYFNALAGGLPGAFGRYDTDYYGNSYREAYGELATHLWDGERRAFLDRIYVVGGCIPDEIARHYLPPNFRLPEKNGPPPDFYVGYTRADCHLRYPESPTILTVQRQGTPLTVIKDLRAEASHP